MNTCTTVEVAQIIWTLGLSGTLGSLGTLRKDMSGQSLARTWRACMPGRIRMGYFKLDTLLGDSTIWHDHQWPAGPIMTENGCTRPFKRLMVVLCYGFTRMLMKEGKGKREKRTLPLDQAETNLALLGCLVVRCLDVGLPPKPLYVCSVVYNCSEYHFIYHLCNLLSPAAWAGPSLPNMLLYVLFRSV